MTRLADVRGGGGRQKKKGVQHFGRSLADPWSRFSVVLMSSNLRTPSCFMLASPSLFSFFFSSWVVHPPTSTSRPHTLFPFSSFLSYICFCFYRSLTGARWLGNIDRLMADWIFLRERKKRHNSAALKACVLSAVAKLASARLNLRQVCLKGARLFSNRKPFKRPVASSIWRQTRRLSSFPCFDGGKVLGESPYLTDAKLIQKRAPTFAAPSNLNVAEMAN